MIHKHLGYIVTFICFWMTFPDAHTQQADIQDNFRDAEYYVFEKRYDKALPFYLKLYEIDSTNYTINYRIGECYYHITREQEKAIPYLEKASEEVSRRFVHEKYEQNVAHINTFLMLGELYQLQEQLGKAYRNYKKYQALLRSGENEEREIIKQHIQSVYVAWELQQLYVPYSAINLGEEVNTRHSDYNPVLSADQDVLAYTSYWETTDLIFFTWKENGEWRKPYNITEMLGSQGDYYTSALSPDGKTLYLVQQDYVDSDFYYSKYEDNEWQSMKKMSNRINSSSLETSLFISSDGQTMLFSSNRSGGHGGLDIYIAYAEKRDKWSRPENLGNVINTPYDEEAPFLADDGKVLFFSSKGHHTMGGYDIFYSMKNEDGSWSEPVNAGYPINTTHDDLFYVPFDEGHTGYFVRDLPGGYGLMDIYQVDIPKHLLFKDKLTGFDEKLQSGYYEEVFAEYTDDNNKNDGNHLVKTGHGPSNSPVTKRLVSSTGQISHVLIPEDTSQSTGNNGTVGRDTIHLDALYDQQKSATREDSNSESRTSQKQDFIHINTLLEKSDKAQVADIDPKKPKTEKKKMNGDAGENLQGDQSTTQTNQSPNITTNTESDKPHRSDKVEKRTHDIPVYTVQIIALLKPVDAGYFNEFEQLTVSTGNDGFTRYTVGEYRGYSAAREALKKVRARGYPRAFIRDIKTIPNYEQ